MLLTHTRLIKNHSKIILILFLLFLSGCASDVIMLPTLSRQTPPIRDQGVVVVRIINASDFPLPFNQLTIIPENLNESSKQKYLRLRSLPPENLDIAVFSSPVDTGRYSLSSVRAFYTLGNGYISKFVGADAKFGTFNVKPGTVTDLGTIIYYPEPQEDKYLELLLRYPGAKKGEVLNKYFPFYQYENNHIDGWNTDDKAEERETLLASITQNPVTFTKTYLAPDKSIYFLAKLGVILKRSANGQWSFDAVDTLLDLNTIAQSNDGTLVVAGGEGKLFFKSTTDKDWIDISLPLKDRVHYLHFNNDNSLDMVISTPEVLSIKRGHINRNKISWVDLNSFSIPNGWSNEIKDEITTTKKTKPKSLQNKQISGTKIYALGKDHFLNLYLKSSGDKSFFSDTDELNYRYNSDDWVMSKIHDDSEVDTILNAGKIKLGIKEAGFWSWNGRPTYLRYIEDSNRWVKVQTKIKKCKDHSIMSTIQCVSESSKARPKYKSFNFRSVPWFKNKLEGIAITSFSKSNFWSGQTSSETKILKTIDGGETWFDTGNKLPKEYCTHLVSEISDRLLLSCMGASSDFYESFDDGKNWENVRQQENF